MTTQSNVSAETAERERELLGGVRALLTSASTEIGSAMIATTMRQTSMLLGQLLRAAAVTTEGLSEEQAAAVGARVDRALKARSDVKMPIPAFAVARAEDGRLRVDCSIDLNALRVAYTGEFGADAKAKNPGPDLHEFTALVQFPALELVLPAPQIVVHNELRERGATRTVIKRDAEGEAVESITIPLEDALADRVA